MRTLPFAFLVAALITVAGCGDANRAAVKGKVTVAGKDPLPGGTIRFELASDPSQVGSGVIRADGTYEISDVPVGECRVTVDNSHLDPNGQSTGRPGMAGGPGQFKMKGMPGGAAGPVMGGKPRDAGKAGGGPPPPGAEVPAGMSEGKSTAGTKYLKIDGNFTKTETTPLRATVKRGSNEFNFDVH
jgi:hypothetical protein